MYKIAPKVKIAPLIRTFMTPKSDLYNRSKLVLDIHGLPIPLGGAIFDDLSFSLCVWVMLFMRSSLGRPLITFLIRKAQCGHVYAAVLSNDTMHRFKRRPPPASGGVLCTWLDSCSQLATPCTFRLATYVYLTLSSQELAGSNIKVCSYGRQPLSPLVLSELNGCEATN